MVLSISRDTYHTPKLCGDIENEKNSFVNGIVEQWRFYVLCA